MSTLMIVGLVLLVVPVYFAIQGARIVFHDREAVIAFAFVAGMAALVVVGGKLIEHAMP